MRLSHCLPLKTLNANRCHVKYCDLCHRYDTNACKWIREKLRATGLAGLTADSHTRWVLRKCLAYSIHALLFCATLHGLALNTTCTSAWVQTSALCALAHVVPSQLKLRPAHRAVLLWIHATFSSLPVPRYFARIHSFPCLSLITYRGDDDENERREEEKESESAAADATAAAPLTPGQGIPGVK